MSGAPRWRSEAGVPAPARIVEVDDTLRADAAIRLASEGAALLWTSDFQNARQLLQAMGRRIDVKPAKPPKPTTATVGASASTPEAAMRDVFNRHRLAQGQRARLLGRVIVRLEPDRSISLPRAPDVRAACAEAWGPPDGEATLVSLRELLGMVGAHEWRKKGVPIGALADRIHPHYGVFSPVRGEYLELVAKAPLPSKALAFDIGTGTGVIAALLARRGVQRIVATDLDERAIACAKDNLQRLGLQERVELQRADLFPVGPDGLDARAPLVVCNPPWLPARPSAPLERAVYDEGGAMLRGFIAGLPAHLAPGGEGWLVMSDFAEHLGLRAKGEIEALVDAAGLRVIDKLGTRAHHPKTQDRSDPLHVARSRETTFLWRLQAK